MHYVYIVRCKDDTLYTGYTTDVERRLREHNEGRAAKYTRSKRPVTLVYSEQCKTKGDALRREHEIKQLKREEKKALFN